jgi:hypothetical protein
MFEPKGTTMPPKTEPNGEPIPVEPLPKPKNVDSEAPRESETATAE